MISGWLLRRRLLDRVCRGESVRHTFLAFSPHRLRWCWGSSDAKGLFATYLWEVDGSWEWKGIMKDTTIELFSCSRPSCWGRVHVIMLKLKRKRNFCWHSGVWFQYVLLPFWEDGDIEEQKHTSWSCLMTDLAIGNSVGTPSYCLQRLPLLLTCTPAEQQRHHCSSDTLNIQSKRMVPFKTTRRVKNREQGVGRAKVSPHSCVWPLRVIGIV